MHFKIPHTLECTSAKFQLYVLKTLQVTTLQSSNTRILNGKISIHWTIKLKGLVTFECNYELDICIIVFAMSLGMDCLVGFSFLCLFKWQKDEITDEKWSCTTNSMPQPQLSVVCNQKKIYKLLLSRRISWYPGFKCLNFLSHRTRHYTITFFYNLSNHLPTGFNAWLMVSSYICICQLNTHTTLVNTYGLDKWLWLTPTIFLAHFTSTINWLLLW